MMTLRILGILALTALVTPAWARDTGDATASDVRRAQQTLADLGYHPGTPDGRIGDRTRTALRNFQRDKGLNATGRLDDDTLGALDTAARRGGDAADADTAGSEAREHVGPEAIRSAQVKLDRLGYPIKQADGTLGAETRTAIRNFQRDHGLNATGQLDDETLAALRSETSTAARSRNR